jgi:hypothetical protein
MTTTHTSEVNVQDLYIVVAGLESQGRFVGYTAITAPLSYQEAVDKWYSSENSKLGVNSRGRKQGHVRHYAVRSLADPRFAPLVGRGYADGRTRDGKHGNGDYGRVKAARAWAKLHGYQGRSGGWIYNASGQVVTQGWHSFVGYLRSNNRIAQGADGLWYVIDRELIA